MTTITEIIARLGHACRIPWAAERSDMIELLHEAIGKIGGDHS